MKIALIGYTGFVGSNLANQTHFDEQFNTSNIQSIDGKKFDLLVSAGARAEKWRINQQPDVDLAEINNLIEHLKKVQTDKLVLISTVDVYKVPINVAEDSVLSTDGLHAYGANRIYLENFCIENFDTLVVRLPGLFGNGLKKNVIYDLLHDNNVDRIHHGGSFQYYNLDYIWKDIQIALKGGLKVVNFATEPVLTSEIAEYCFGISDFSNEPEGVSAGSYDMHTKYAADFGVSGDYIYSKQQVLEDIKRYVESQKQLLANA